MADFLKLVTPTLASAVLGPLGGVAVAAIGHILGISDATTEKVAQAFQDGKITPEQLAEILNWSCNTRARRPNVGSSSPSSNSRTSTARG